MLFGTNVSNGPNEKCCFALMFLTVLIKMAFAVAGGPAYFPGRALCEFLCAPSLTHNEKPNKAETSVREKQKNLFCCHRKKRFTAIPPGFSSSFC